MQGFVYKNKSLGKLAEKTNICLENFDHRCPMPIGSLSKAIGMEIESKKLDVLGWFDSDLSKIFVDKKQDAFYQRFIIAHELGHYAAGDGSSYMKSPPKYTEQEHIKEKKANTFAAELLIPQITLLEKIKETNDSDDLSLFFEVPKEIMVARLLELGIPYQP